MSGIILALTISAFMDFGRAAQASGPIRVVVWDERQPAQKQAYENFLGNHLAEFLRGFKKNGRPEFDVKSVGLDDPDQGLPNEVLDNCDVLLWWGHQRHDEVKDALVREIVHRILAGKLSLIALHSAHWSRPFTEAMNERAVADALKTLAPGQQAVASGVRIPADRRLMERSEKLTPYFTRETGDLGIPVLRVKLPSCVFAYVAAEGKPSHITILQKNHPIVKGVPDRFDIPQTECYGGPFHVPTPDSLILEEKWDNGQRFPSGCVWKVGNGTVFYFRPGHETYKVFKHPHTLKIIENATSCLGSATNK